MLVSSCEYYKTAYINGVSSKVFIEVIKAWHKVVKLFHILEGGVDAILSPEIKQDKLPWGHKEHRLSLEMFDIIVAKLLIMIVLQDLKPVRGLKLTIVQGLEGDAL